MPFPKQVQKRKASRNAFVPTPVAIVAWAMLHGAAAQAQQAAPEASAPLVLRPSPLLQEQIPSVVRRELPTFVEGDRTSGRPELDTMVEGNAVLRKGDTVIRADRLEYYQPDDLAKARGNVRLNRAGNVYEGPELELKVDSFEGFFNSPRYQFLRNDAHGEAERADFIDDKRSVIKNATYTTCRRTPGPSWMPDWILRASTIRLDTEEDVGQAEGALLTFFDVPVLPVPSISFPLSDKRKTGLLPPTIGLDSTSGLEVTLPYYLNIAPNRDATLYPTLMSKRGIDLGGEFRYLESDYRGQVRANYMPTDSLRDSKRWSYVATHDAILRTGAPVLGNLALNLNLNRVSDDNYWRDFSNSSASLTQRLLPSDGILSWGEGNLSGYFRTLKWQTLQDVTSPITPPYDRAPQLFTRYARAGVGGFDYSVDVDYTQFKSVSALTLQPNAERSYVLGQISRPWLTPGSFITPKLQLHSTQYRFDAPLASGASTASRVVPTFSLDSGLVFERNTSYFGRGFLQTLEPRAFYTYTPYRDQRQLPVYDSGANDFNFATVYTENAFSGHDRISDNNLLTVGVTSRLLDPADGAEIAKVGIAQRLRFKDQNVTLPGGTPVADRLSDVLVGGSFNWDKRWTFDSMVQFNPKTNRSERTTIGGRYSPGNYRVVSAAYRMQRGLSEQLDIGWQWPINDLWGDKGQELGAGRGQGEGRWYSVGRMNYSLRDSKLVDTLIGLEYDAGCWIGRIVFERLQSSQTSSNKRILFQIEFIGFTRLGSNPLQTLRNNIPRYQYLREKVDSPSRFTRYD